MQDKSWSQFAMLQSLDDGTLAFLHRSTYGPKAGDENQKNPLKRYWPDYITNPISGDLAAQLISWDIVGQKQSINKSLFSSDDFTCTSKEQTLQTLCPTSRRASKSKFDKNLHFVQNSLNYLMNVFDDVLELENF